MRIFLATGIIDFEDRSVGCSYTKALRFVMRGIFINYRRGESAAAAGRLYDQLLRHFDRDNLFLDVDAIEPGIDFVNALNEQVARCDVFLAIIGPNWIESKDKGGGRRLDDPNDYVRVEIEAALKRDIRVIPVLVDGAVMPSASTLPKSLARLARRNAIEVSHTRFASDVEGLARSLKKAFGTSSPLAEVTDSAAPALVSVDPAQNWGALFFSFRGRISRKPFWIASSVIILAVFVLGGAVLLTLTFMMGPEAATSTGAKILLRIPMLPTYYSALAVGLKRLHDIGQGWELLAPVVAVSLVSEGLDIAAYDQGATMLTVALVAAFLLVGCIKGMPGPNEFGPDPLASKAAPGSPR